MLLGTALLIAVSSTGTSAMGDTVDGKRAEVARLQDELDAQAERMAIVDRRFDIARERAGQADAAVTHARAELAAADRRMAEIGARLASAAVEAYVKGNSVSILEQLDATDGTDLAVRNQYFKVTAAGHREALDALRAAREDLTLKRSRLELAQRSARSAAASVENQLQAIAEAEAGQRSRLARATGELGVLLQQEQARRSAQALRDAEAAAAARASARVRVAGSAGLAPVLPGHTPPGGLWACIRQRESSGNYRIGGGGAYQFQQPTWEALGGSGRPEDADPATQDAMAVRLQQRSGWGQWTTARACGAF